MKRKHKSKVEKICSKERPTVTQKLHDMREECENKRHLRFLVSDNGPRMRACQVAIPGNGAMALLLICMGENWVVCVPGVLEFISPKKLSHHIYMK